MIAGTTMIVGGILLAGYAVTAPAPVLYGLAPLLAVGLMLAGVVRIDRLPTAPARRPARRVHPMREIDRLARHTALTEPGICSSCGEEFGMGTTVPGSPTAGVCASCHEALEDEAR